MELVPRGGDVPGGSVEYSSLSDVTMNGQGSDGNNPLVVEPEDRIGPTEEAPTRLFWQAEPHFHWHVAMEAPVDHEARSAIESIAQDAFRFGCQTEQHERELLTRVEEMEQVVMELRTKIESMHIDVGKLRGQIGELETKLALDQRRRRQESVEMEQYYDATMDERV